MGPFFGSHALGKTESQLAFSSRVPEGTRHMTLDALLPLPPPGFETTSEYRLTPRPKRAFHRFEGPYGPPGAPELIMELID